MQRRNVLLLYRIYLASDGQLHRTYLASNWRIVPVASVSFRQYYLQHREANRLFFPSARLIAFGMQLMFYGLYFGVLSRDFAEICADSMASVIGYYRSGGGIANKQLPKDVCAICGEKLADDDVEKIVKLYRECAPMLLLDCK